MLEAQAAILCNWTKAEKQQGFFSAFPTFSPFSSSLSWNSAVFSWKEETKFLFTRVFNLDSFAQLSNFFLISNRKTSVLGLFTAFLQSICKRKYVVLGRSLQNQKKKQLCHMIPTCFTDAIFLKIILAYKKFSRLAFTRLEADVSECGISWDLN